MQELEQYYTIVEEAISSLGVPPEKSRGKDPGQWNLQRKELVIWVDLWNIEKVERPFFQVLTPIMTLPEAHEREDLYRELLEINNSIFVVSFAIHQGNVYLKSVREAAGLSVEDVKSTLHYCGYYSEYYAERLINKFGGKKLVNEQTDN